LLRDAEVSQKHKGRRPVPHGLGAALKQPRSGAGQCEVRDDKKPDRAAWYEPFFFFEIARLRDYGRAFVMMVKGSGVGGQFGGESPLLHCLLTPVS
jgi:hypothetical protein